MSEPGRSGSVLLACLAVVAAAAATFVIVSRQSELAVDVPHLTGSFDPTRDQSARIDVRVREDERDARITILDSEREEVAVVAEGLALEAGRTRSLSWDGRVSGDAERIAPPGRYKVRIELPAASRDARWIKRIRVLDPGEDTG